MLCSCHAFLLQTALSHKMHQSIKLVAAHLPSDIIVWCLDSAFLLVRKDLEVGHLASQSLFAAYSSCPRVSD